MTPNASSAIVDSIRAQTRSAVAINGLTKKFGSFTALDDVSLDVASGELICFLGPSGCGKTTLLRVIAGLEEATTGQILLAGEDVTDLPPVMRDFGIVFQSYALFPNLNVAQNIGYGLVNQRWPRARIKARVTEMLALIGLPGIEAKYPAALSGGQQQRVALARALASSPKLLLLDEPLAALDANVRVHLRAQIVELQKQAGVTTIMVTHDQEEALSMADRIVLMDHGVIRQVGSPEDLYERPANLFAARFIGAINDIPCTIADTGHVTVGTMAIPCDTEGFGSGQSAHLCIRPEAVHVGGTGMAAELVTIEFLGLSYKLMFRLGDIPDQLVEVNLDRGSFRKLGVCTEGDTTTLSFPTEAIQLFEVD